ncbi:Uncharacterised protein [Clostridioides difficile]|uniref:hypothetical protein n=1 Tax=Clostridioides difficile TaxID=1496 RepID=UPI000D1F7EAF|nr:hypothetical protein [Clostridioides difficile]UWD43133.1 hypothetical protein NYF05_09175 [Clostridioides difficile]UWD43327.1 hypothetical protein NYU56_08920 [Clostridioides difficile]VFF94214.1 Uncharacterised protein [Clostridioides difficile]VIG01604.1 Uncharacterised protein [Clostridioides difficile]HBE9436057.1 hypothetical protein [Clostridioides difficile]
MNGLLDKFDLERIKAGNAVKVNCKRFGFEIDCIVVVATENELNLAYFDEGRGCMEYQALITEDIQDGDYEIKILS